jgi:hypothetical protein
MTVLAESVHVVAGAFPRGAASHGTGGHAARILGRTHPARARTHRAIQAVRELGAV